MSPEHHSWTDEYSSALAEYIECGGERALQQAYRAGQGALAAGASILRLVELHHECMSRPERPAARHSEEMWTRSLPLLLRGLSAFEMVPTGFQEPDAGLHLRNDQMDRQTPQLPEAEQPLRVEGQRNRNLSGFAPDPYVVTDLHGTIREVNGAAAKLLGVSAKQLLGRPLIDSVSRGDQDRLRAWLARGCERGWYEADVELGLLTKPTGDAVPVSVRVVVEETADGIARGLRWLIRDVTPRTLARAEGTRSPAAGVEGDAARGFRFLSEASSFLLESLDVPAALTRVARLAVPFLGDWCFLHVLQDDGSFRRLPAVAAPEIENAPEWSPLFQPGILSGAAGPFAGPPVPKLLSEISPEWLEEFGDGPPESGLLCRIPARSAVFAPFAMHDRCLGAITLFSCTRVYSAADLEFAVDLAQRSALALEKARLYREAVSERDRAEQASIAKDEFLAILSHELRNSLMPVMGWARVFKNHEAARGDSILVEGVESLERNSRNLARLVNDCLDLVRISQGKIQIDRERLDLNEVVRASIDAVREVAWRKRLALLAELSSGPLWVSGDRTRLQQVVMNLLVNAVKFTPSGGCVRVESAHREHEAEIAVSDTGIGIDPAYLEEIFEPFKQGTRTGLPSEPGLGLGLTISRQMIGLHQGRVWGESAGPGFGTCFRIRLPLSAVADQKDRGSTAVPKSTCGPLRILVVEDSPDIRDLIKLEMEALGHSVFTAADGASGVECARKHRPDLILSDIKMPGVDGFDFIRAIRALPETASIPSIALTGFGMRDETNKALEAGFDAYLCKPVEFEELELCLQKLTTSSGHAASYPPRGHSQNPERST